MTTKHRSVEQGIQLDLLKLCRLYAPQEPAFGRLYHIPNGGLRSKVEAKIMQGMGVRSGLPDLHLPIFRHFHHPEFPPEPRMWPLPPVVLNSLYIELKKPGGKLSANQVGWIDWLLNQGHCVHVCDSVDSAWATLCWYLSPRNHETRRMMFEAVGRNYAGFTPIRLPEWTERCQNEDDEIRKFCKWDSK